MSVIDDVLDGFAQVDGGVLAPEGFVGGVSANAIKPTRPEKLDVAVICSEKEAAVAGVFTQNQVKAAPVRWSQEVVGGEKARAVVVNSGNANACTGEQGAADAEAMASKLAELVPCESNEVLVCSTGIIGMPLPMEKVLGGIAKSHGGLARDQGAKIAEAMMTSDTVPKSLALEIELGGKKVRIGGVTKGAGMLCPSMATMIAVITTDAEIEPVLLQKMLSRVNASSFNCITVDGDMSTNDTVLALANGASGVSLREGSEEAKQFEEALKAVSLWLAVMMVKDGEKVTKLVTLNVSGAKSDAEAREVAMAVGNSQLVKSSWNGEDPNWGRVMHAVGYAKACVDPSKASIAFDGIVAAEHGVDAGADLQTLVAVAKKPEFVILIDLGLGEGSATVYASDLSPEYVEYNQAEYAAALFNG